MMLVVGSDSLIGAALLDHLQRAGRRAVGTTRRTERVDATHLYLDLTEEPSGWRCPEPVEVAVLCAGATKMEACRRDPCGSARINVQGMMEWAQRFVAEGAFVIYLSTNQVFDGTMPYRLPDDPRCPVTEYGWQKAEAERQIGRFSDAVAIVRLTKVLGPAEPLFAAWVEELRAGRAIHPFSNVVLAPVPVSCAVSMVSWIADRRLPGICQISGDRDLTYAQAARLGADALNADQALIQPIDSSQSTHYAEHVPLHTTLNTDRLTRALGVVPPPVRWTLEAVFTQPETLGGSWAMPERASARAIR